MPYKKKYIKFHLRVFWSVAAFFVLLTVSFIAFQYYRERQYKIEQLNNILSGKNEQIYYKVKESGGTNLSFTELPYRVTIMNLEGDVLYDSEAGVGNILENHSDRKEVWEAIQQTGGYDVRRKSQTTGEIYFYSAQRHGEYIIRTALPYDNDLIVTLKADLHFIPIAILILLLAGVLFYTVMKRLGESIDRLKRFVSKAYKEEIIESPTDFPNNELGDISRHIAQIYNKLIRAKKDLEIEQLQVAAQKEEKDLIKRQLTQNIAHELKTPVSSIQGYLETIIEDENMTREVLDDFIEKSYVQSTRLSSLLQDISYLTRIDEAPELIKREPVDIAKLIREVISDVSFQLNANNIKIVNKSGDMPLPCYGSLSLLYSIFRNLFDNTIAYAGNNIEAEIELYKEDMGRYFFSYSDTGIGIPQEHLPRIFERFYRVDKGRSRKAGGTGLGLSVVKHAVQFHRGDISAQQRPGGGIIFLFSIAKDS